jgi:hypothetical protein
MEVDHSGGSRAGTYCGVLLRSMCALLQPALRGGALRTIEQREYVTNGPLQLVQGNFGTIARIPIFIQNSTLNETFGTNKTRKWRVETSCYHGDGPSTVLPASNDQMQWEPYCGEQVPQTSLQQSVMRCHVRTAACDAVSRLAHCLVVCSA